MVSIISYGGGVQSTAMVVLAIKGRLGLDVDAAVFANVGDDSEYPATIQYVREVMTPWAADHGFPVEEIGATRFGEPETLYGRLTRPNSRSLPIPVRMSNGAPGKRSCTGDFKIKVIGRWLKAHGATVEQPAQVAIGISPFHTIAAWQSMRIEDPELFDKSCELEDTLNARRDDLGRDHVYLTRRGKPLREVIPEGVAFLPFAEDDDDTGCDSGHCMT